MTLSDNAIPSLFFEPKRGRRSIASSQSSLSLRFRGRLYVLDCAIRRLWTPLEARTMPYRCQRCRLQRNSGGSLLQNMDSQR